MSGWFQTYTGKKVYPLEMTPNDICIEDIAHSLSLQCRFSGHSGVFYSVGQHSVLVANNCPKHLRLKGLLHDASEAYLVDIPRPLKNLPEFSLYRKFEEKIQNTIFGKYGLSDGIPDEVHYADNLLLATEARILLGKLLPGWNPVTPYLKEEILPLCPADAEKLFLDSFSKFKKGE